MKKYLFIVFIVLISLAPLWSQISQGEVLDKIVAVVGNEIIMKSDVDGQIMVLKQQNPGIDVNDTEIRNQVLKSLIDENLVIAKAIEDSIVVTDDEINQEWERFKENLVNYYGSVKRIEDVYGKSMTRIQYEYRDNIRKKLLGQKLQQEKFGNINVSPYEVQKFFDEYKDSLPEIPEQYVLYHIVRYVVSSRKAKEKIFELASKVRDSIINGSGDFKDFAMKYSQDPGSASDGGNLGWAPKGKFLHEFEKAAFELAPGKISMPVETPFGFHLIQTLKKKKDSVLVRHILFRVGETEKDIERTKKLLLTLKDSVKAGVDFEELAKRFSEEKDTRGFGGYIGTLPLESIPLSFKDIITSMKDGEVTDPMSYNTEPTKKAFHIIYLKKHIPKHQPDIKKDFELIKQRATSYKQLQMYQDWIKQLRKDLYWEIKGN